ncbi:glycosyltransferase family 4 protein [Pseudochryseolinea flava]|uniref:Glycosyltransferase WbuB n=1 Tax=Pseudochryseolinea flava TaxID=2059302 RepID=A0A364YAQ4_9BACT|nr:glycosyltransferase family 4 protein [Pseudochryseolinea flava]RAW03212.1 glycosyltransferase WbuB [Pseudochryseolinea flava]
MRVLILHQHFNTPAKGGPLRSYYLAQSLVDFGFEPVVLTIHNEDRYRIENLNGIEIHYLPIPYDNSFSFFKRSVSFLRYVIAVIQMSTKLRHIKICYAISTPLTVGLAALYVKRRWRIPYIFEVGDLWPDAPIDLGYVKNILLKKSLLNLEKKIYQNASSIVALSTAIKETIERKVAGKKMHLIPNMADVDYYKPVSKPAELIKKFEVEGKFVITYCGALGAANGLEHILRCALESQEHNLPAKFLICGEGAVKVSLMERASQMQLQNVSFIPFQTREGVRDILNVSDAVMISYKPFAVLETGSPNKYFDGLAAGKMIITNFGGWIGKEIQEERCGIVIDQKLQSEFPRLIQPFIENSSLLVEYQQASRKLAQAKYARRKLSERFVEAIQEVLSR